MVVDPHVHFRDFNQREKETIRHGLEVARDTGVDAVFDMPNSDPPIMTRDLVIERLNLAEDAGVPEVFYGLWMGLTEDKEQVKRAVAVYEEFFPRVIGFKLYAGHSVGKLGVIGVDSQYGIYETLAAEGFNGIMAMHCEKENEMNHDLFDKENPITHCLARPVRAEIASIKDQIAFAKAADYNGKLHIAHITTPYGVSIVQNARSQGLSITCGVCPHHFMMDDQRMIEKDGLLYKMNPPLREQSLVTGMLELLRNGSIDWVETDHAPHTLNDKIIDCSSGLPGVHKWQLYKEFMRMHGFTESRIERVTHTAFCETAGVDIPQRNTYRKDRTNDYEFNPWEGIERLVSETINA